MLGLNGTMSVLQHFCSYQSCGFEICCFVVVDLNANYCMAKTATIQGAQYALVLVQFFRHKLFV